MYPEKGVENPWFQTSSTSNPPLLHIEDLINISTTSLYYTLYKYYYYHCYYIVITVKLKSSAQLEGHLLKCHNCRVLLRT